MAASGHQATPSAAGQAASCRDPRGRPGRGLSLQSRPLPSAPPASPENAILQENVGQEPTPTRLWWPRTHNHADLQSPPGARDGPAGTPQSSAGGRAPPYLKLLIPRETREFSELQLNACHLRHRAIRGPLGWVSSSSANVYNGVWNLRGCSEGRHQPISKILLIHNTAMSQRFLLLGGLVSMTRW